MNQIRHIVSTFKIMIVGGDQASSRLLPALNPFGYHLEFITDTRKALSLLESHIPDIVVASNDLEANKCFEFVRAVRSQRNGQEVLLLVVLADESPDQEIRAFQIGADEVVGYSSSDLALRARIRVLLRLSTYRRRIQNENRRLSLRVDERTKELFDITIATVAALEKASELSDQETGHHMMRVAHYASLLAEDMGIGSEMIEKIRLYAPLHDVGKVGVPHEILKKKGVLTPAEFEQMKRHTGFGYELLRAAKADDVACNIALDHHERMDGTGYPNGKLGKDIQIEARIVAVADVFDALTTKRHYKEALPTTEALIMITGDLSKGFDSDVVNSFNQRFKDIVEVFRSY